MDPIYIHFIDRNKPQNANIFSPVSSFVSTEKKSHIWNDMKVIKWHYCHFWMNYAVFVFFLGGTEIIDGCCETQRCHTGFKAEGWHSLVGSLGWGCVMVVLVPLHPLSVTLRAQLLGHAASICLQRWGATHHQHSQSIIPRVKSKLSSSTHDLRAWELMPCQSKPMHL